MAIDKDVLDRLLAGRDPQELFAKIRLDRRAEEGVVGTGYRLAGPLMSARDIAVVRTIDALAEGASLRAVGQGIVSREEWPGPGE